MLQYAAALQSRLAQPPIPDGGDAIGSAPSTAFHESLPRPLRVAIVGSGPSGFYAAESLFKADVDVAVTMFERLPVPYGLVRFGVAPDHAKIRSVIKTYEKTADDERFSFFGNVAVGEDVSIDELRAYFDAVVLAFGAATDRKLNIPGEDLPRSYTATSFCAWYNGHPDYRDCRFDLSQEVAVVIGQGNVAMDVARILALPADELAKTDMAAHAVQTLAESKIKEIHVVGRRGPVQAKFTPKEIGELGKIDGCDLIVDPADLVLDPTNQAELDLPENKPNRRNFEILQEFAERGATGAPRKIVVDFFKSPVEIQGDQGVERVVLERNELSGEPGAQRASGTGETETVDCGVFFRSVGYRGMAMPGVPFDEQRAVIPNENGRVDDASGLYCTGWIKRGPSGLIGTNKADSQETVAALLEDLDQLAPATHRDNADLADLLRSRDVRFVTFEDWKKIDEAEIEAGRATGKPRENFTTVEEMLSVIGR